MTHRIFKSVSARVPDFDVAVAGHAAAMKEWRAHMERVRLDEANGVTGIEKHEPYNRPNAHPAVDAAVNENGDADFEIVDDMLDLRKANLIEKISRAEQAAIAAVVPPTKVRLFNMIEADIREQDAKVVQSLATSSSTSLLSSAAEAIGLKKKMTPERISAEVNEQRTDEEQRHLADQKERRQRIAAIQRIAAQAHHDIEDLTLDTIDAWAMPDFN